jgi:hypothetical protein
LPIDRKAAIYVDKVLKGLALGDQALPGCPGFSTIVAGHATFCIRARILSHACARGAHLNEYETADQQQAHRRRGGQGRRARSSDRREAPVVVSTTRISNPWVGAVRTFGFYNAEQDCTAACRTYAGAKIYAKLVANLSDGITSW